jgi:hypothetical protein
MYFAFAQDLMKQEVNLHLFDKKTWQNLRRELLSVRYTSGTTIKIESKEQIKKRIGHSPNLADAVVYWNWVRRGWYW